MIVDSTNQTLHLILRFDNLQEFLTTQNLHAHRQRYLQPEWEEWLVQETGMLPKYKGLHLQVELPASETIAADKLQAMMHQHFKCMQQKVMQEKKATLWQGYKYLAIAILFLLLMTIGYNLIDNYAPDNKYSNTMQDALVILGWVAFWRPAELLLYDWHPFKTEAKIYERLAAMQVVIHTY
jgi:hypothetical protein